MKEIIFDDLLEKIPNKYLLTVIAGKRAREIYSGSDPYIACDPRDTVVKKVLTEILSDRIVVEDEGTATDSAENSENDE